MSNQREEGMTKPRLRLRKPGQQTTAGRLHTTLLSVCRLMVHQAAKWTTEELAEHEQDLAECEAFSSPPAVNDSEVE